jgi:indolepyruvate ferredoxin oxidoreductase
VTPITAPTEARRLSGSLNETIERRVAFLSDYQSAAYAKRYRDIVERVRAAEAAKAPGETGLSEAVAKYLFKLMAYKDEYEVARLFTDGAFEKQVAAAFDGKLRYEFHLAPPLLAKKDPSTGRPRKMSFGPWIKPVFGVLAKFKFLRGTPLDPFGYSEERKLERKLIADYVANLEELIATLTPQNRALAVAVASIPEKIRGFGPIKPRSVTAAKAEESVLLTRLRNAVKSGEPAPVAAAAE